MPIGDIQNSSRRRKLLYYSLLVILYYLCNCTVTVLNRLTLSLRNASIVQQVGQALDLLSQADDSLVDVPRLK